MPTYLVFPAILAGITIISCTTYVVLNDLIEGPDFVDLETMMYEHGPDMKWWLPEKNKDVTFGKLLLMTVSSPIALLQKILWYPLYILFRLIPKVLGGLVIFKSKSK